MKTQRPNHYHSTDVIHDKAKKQIKLFNCRQIPEEIQRFDVVLEGGDRVFFSGDTIQGEVQIDLSGCLTVQGIIVRLVGEAYVNVPDEPGRFDMRHIARLRSNFRRNNKISPVLPDSAPETPEKCVESPARWVAPSPSRVTPPVAKRPARRRDTQQQQFRSYEKYFEHKVFVFGHKYSSRREQLWAGSHAFPFHYTLPTKLPASFHGRYGYVRYFCEASLERSRCPSIQTRTFFSVTNIADVNSDAKSDSGSGGQTSTNSCLFCCQKGTIIVSAGIRRRGFVPGEDILLMADIINMSNRQVKRSCARLRQVVTYFSNKGFLSHECEASVTEVYRGPVPSGESDAWERVRIPVPPLPPTSKFDNCCKLMDIEYRLDFIVELAGDPDTLDLHMPILVGTVPLHREFPNLQGVTPEMEKLQQEALAEHVKYNGLPAVFTAPCVWGPRPVDAYYYRHVARRPEPVSKGGQTPLQHLPGTTFAPLYLWYEPLRREEPDPRDELRGARDVPQIVVTRPPDSCQRHRHPRPARRHSAPGQLPPPPPPDPRSPERRPPELTLNTLMLPGLPDIPECK